MVKGIIVITGVGSRPAQRIFPNSQKDALFDCYYGKYKHNASSAAARLLLENDYHVVAISGCKHCLARLKELCGEKNISYHHMDVADEPDIDPLIKTTTELKAKLDVPVHIMHYGSVTEINIKETKGNVFVHTWDLPGKYAGELVHKNVAAMYRLLQGLKPLLKEQKQTKVIIMSSLAGVRTGPFCGLDGIQKAAVHAMSRTLAHDLTKEGIYVTEIMPGTTDTGWYDQDVVLEAKLKREASFGYSRTEQDLPLISAQRIAETILFILETNAHIREISLIPFGQFPHTAA